MPHPHAAVSHGLCRHLAARRVSGSRRRRPSAASAGTARPGWACPPKPCTVIVRRRDCPSERSLSHHAEKQTLTRGGWPAGAVGRGRRVVVRHTSEGRAADSAERRRAARAGGRRLRAGIPGLLRPPVRPDEHQEGGAKRPLTRPLPGTAEARAGRVDGDLGRLGGLRPLRTQRLPAPGRLGRSRCRRTRVGAPRRHARDPAGDEAPEREAGEADFPASGGGGKAGTRRQARTAAAATGGVAREARHTPADA